MIRCTMLYQCGKEEKMSAETEREWEIYKELEKQQEANNRAQAGKDTCMEELMNLETMKGEKNP